MGDIYISPDGAGDFSGSDPANAMSFRQIDKAIALAGPGGEVRMIADQGAYEIGGTLHITNGGAEEAPVTIRGYSSDGTPMTATIFGARDPNPTGDTIRGNELFKIYEGADNLVFTDLNIENVGTAFRIAGDIENLTIEDISASNVSRFLEDLATSGTDTATVSGLTVRDIDVTGFSKGVIRLQYDSNDILIENITADAAGQNFDYFNIGLHLDDTAHDVVVRNVQIANVENYDRTYYNGDAFATERGVYNVLFEDTVAIGSTDAGYDLKSQSTTLLRPVSIENSKNYKFWGEITVIDAVGMDPQSSGPRNGQFQIEINENADVTFEGGYFSDSGSDTYFLQYNSGQVDFIGTQLYMAVDASILRSKVPENFTLSAQIVQTTGEYSSGTDYSDFQQTLPVSDLQDALDFNDSDVSISNVDEVIAVEELAADSMTTETADVESDASGPVPATGSATCETGFTNGDDITKAAYANQAHFVDNIAYSGHDRIESFGVRDTLFLTEAITESDFRLIDKDTAVIEFASGGSLTLDKMNVSKGLRYLGEAGQDGQTYHVYASGLTPLRNTVEGTVGDDIMDAAGGNIRYFYDSALGVHLGSDKIQNFSNGDKIITTSALQDADGDGLVALGMANEISLSGGDPEAIDQGSIMLESIGDDPFMLQLLSVSTRGGLSYYEYGYTDMPG